MTVFPLTTGTIGGANSTNSFPASIGPNALRNTQIMLNGVPMYQQLFTNQYQYYREFKTQCIAASSSQACHTPISYQDWLCGVNPYTFDLSRNQTVKSDNQCSLTLVTDVVASATGTPLAAPFDLVVLLERLQTIKLKVSEGGVVMSVQQGGPVQEKQP